MSERLTRLLEALDKELPAALELRRALHRTPELGYREVETSAQIVAALAPVATTRVLETGVLARVGRGDAPPVVVRAELDALPIEERSGAPYAAVNGAMHACGHDVHMAALVALTRALARVEPDASIPFVALFQPSEEAPPSGAQALIEQDALGFARARAVGAVHVHPDLPAGEVAVQEGSVNASCDDVHVVVRGRESHAAYPHQGRDPVLALAAIVVAAQQLVSRRTDPLHAAVVSLTRLQAGSGSNVIPGTAEAWGTLRALDPADREPLAQRLREVVTHVAAAHGCESELTLAPGEPVLVNDARLGAAVRPQLAHAGLRPSATGFRSCGSDDFSFLGTLGPALMLFAGVRGAQLVADVPLHDSRFLPGDAAVAAVARCAACFHLAATAPEAS